MNFGKQNQHETMPEWATRQGGTPTRGRRALGPRGHTIRRLMPFSRCKKANIRIKIVSNNQPNRSYGSPGI